MSSKIWSNDGTYQTIKEVKIDDPSKPIWLREENQKKSINLCVGTPVHSEVSIHYAQCLLELQKHMLKIGDNVSFLMHKSSLVTQGRNLTVASFLDTEADYLLFLDSDKLIKEPQHKADKTVITSNILLVFLFNSSLPS